MSIKIALAGNPNCGKTSLFNVLTGSNQYVGNWPGVTVEKKEGQLKGHKDVIIQDLPGIYSLSPYTPEEVISRNFILEEKGRNQRGKHDHAPRNQRKLHGCGNAVCRKELQIIAAVGRRAKQNHNGERLLLQCLLDFGHRFAAVFQANGQKDQKAHQRRERTV